MEDDDKIKVLGYLSGKWAAGRWPSEKEDSTLSDVVWEKLDKFKRCYWQVRQHLPASVSREDFLGEQLSAMLRPYVDRNWLLEAWHAWNQPPSRCE